VQAIHLSPLKIGNGTNSCAVITYHVSIRHSPHTLNSHTRSSFETPGLAPFVIECSLGTLRARCMSARRRERLYGKKKDKTRTERERDRVNTLCGVHPWLIRLTFLSRDESNNDEGASLKRGSSGVFRGMFRSRYNRCTNTRISAH